MHYNFDADGNRLAFHGKFSPVIADDQFAMQLGDDIAVIQAVPEIFAGHPWDAAIDQYHMQARVYDPATARFASTDPMGYGAGDSNLYRYVGGDPVNYVDPDGRFADSIWDGISVSLGLYSLGHSINRGDVVGTAIDAVGLVVDVAAFLLPFVPGGAGYALRAWRGVDAASGTLQGVNHATDVALGTFRTLDAGIQIASTGQAAYQGNVGGVIFGFAGFGIRSGQLRNLDEGASGVTLYSRVDLGVGDMVARARRSSRNHREGISSAKPTAAATQSIGELRAAGLSDAHHVIQDAAVRELRGYSTTAARGVQMPGPSTARETPHYAATQVQRQSGGGTYAAERRIGYKALRRAGHSEGEARQAIQEADNYFFGIGVQLDTPTRIPGNRLYG